MNAIEFIYDDGGRRAAGFRGTTGDCGVRAIAIATGKPYKEVYTDLRRLANDSPRNGMPRKIVHKYLLGLDFQWTPTMHIGSGCKVHLREDELPMGRLVLSLSRHYTAVVDGHLYDTYDCSRDGTRCVYGYWRLESDLPQKPFDLSTCSCGKSRCHHIPH